MRKSGFGGWKYVNTTKKITVPGMNNGTGMMTAKMYMDEQGKIIPCSIHAGGSIGLHRHETGDEDLVLLTVVIER